MRIYQPNTDTLTKVRNLEQKLGRAPTGQDYINEYGGSKSTANRAIAVTKSSHYPNFENFSITEEDVDDYIAKNLPNTSAYVIGAELGISNEAVRQRVQQFPNIIHSLYMKNRKENRCTNCGLPISPQAHNLCKECYDEAVDRFNRLRDSG